MSTDASIDLSSPIPLLVIGAGPFGLALGGYATSLGIPYLLLGESMAFWTQHMPKGMLLRSNCDWHLDPTGAHTIDEYLATAGQQCSQVEPLSLDFYLRYADWFMKQKALRPLPAMVRRLDGSDDGFVATLDTGSVVRARNVVVAVGLGYFPNCPAEITDVLPTGSFAHTCDCVDLEKLSDRRCLIIGGRQSAFEWTALLREANAAAVHVCYRHDTPAFEPSDWSWIPPLVEQTRTDPGWYRRLSESEQQAITHHFWLEGRAKLEPWLAPRIDHDSVHLWPHTRVINCTRSDSGDLRVTLDNGNVIEVDDIILATGYRFDIRRIPFLEHSNLWQGLRTRDGYPELDDSFETSHKGLFFTGLAAAQDFGPFFGFTVAVRVSAERISNAILPREAGSKTRKNLR